MAPLAAERHRSTHEQTNGMDSTPPDGSKFLEAIAAAEDRCCSESLRDLPQLGISFH
jgi:hypothetical protein